MDIEYELATRKFEDLQKYVPFLEDYLRIREDNARKHSNNVNLEKHEKYQKLLKLLRGGYQRHKLSLLQNIESTLRKLIEQTSKQIKKENLDESNAPGTSSIQSSSIDSRVLANTKNNREALGFSTERNVSYPGDEGRDRRNFYTKYENDSYRHNHERRYKRSRSRSRSRNGSHSRHRSRSRGRSGNRSRSRSPTGQNAKGDMKRDRFRSSHYNNYDRYEYQVKRERLDDYDRGSSKNVHVKQEKSTYQTNRTTSQIDYNPIYFDQSAILHNQRPKFEINNTGGQSRFILPNPVSSCDRFAVKKEQNGCTQLTEVANINETIRATNERFGRSKNNNELVDALNDFEELKKMKDNLIQKQKREVIASMCNKMQSDGDYEMGIPSPNKHSDMGKETTKNEHANETDPDQIPKINSLQLHFPIIQPTVPHISDTSIFKQSQNKSIFVLPENEAPTSVACSANVQTNSSEESQHSAPVMNCLQTQDYSVDSNEYTEQSNQSVSTTTTSRHEIPKTSNHHRHSFDRGHSLSSTSEPILRKANMTYGEHRRAKQLENAQCSSANNTSMVSSTTSSYNKDPHTWNQNQLRSPPIAKESQSTITKSSTSVIASVTRKPSDSEKATKSISKFKIPKLSRTDNYPTSNVNNQKNVSKHKKIFSQSDYISHPKKNIHNVSVPLDKSSSVDIEANIKNYLADSVKSGKILDLLKDSISEEKYKQLKKNIRGDSNDGNEIDNGVSSSTQRPTSMTSSTAPKKTAKKSWKEVERLNTDICENIPDIHAIDKRSCTRKDQQSPQDKSNKPRKSNTADGELVFMNVNKRKNSTTLPNKSITDSDNTDDDIEHGYKNQKTNSRTQPETKQLSDENVKKLLNELRIGDCVVKMHKLTDDDIEQHLKRLQLNANAVKNIDKNMTIKEAKVCVLCKKQQSRMSNHYKYSHGNCEIYNSRMSVENSDHLRRERPKLSEISHCSREYIVHCYFCEKTVRGHRGDILEHIVRHTGDYEKQCVKCMTTITSNTSKSAECSHTATKIIPHIPLSENISVFMCNLCNYVQCMEINMEQHMKKMHGIDADPTKSYRTILVVCNLTKSRNTARKSAGGIETAARKSEKNSCSLEESNSMDRGLLNNTSSTSSHNLLTTPSTVDELCEYETRIKVERQDDGEYNFRISGPLNPKQNTYTKMMLDNLRNCQVKLEKIEDKKSVEPVPVVSEKKEKANNSIKKNCLSTCAKSGKLAEIDDNTVDDDQWESCSTESDDSTSQTAINASLNRLCGKTKPNKIKKPNRNPNQKTASATTSQKARSDSNNELAEHEQDGEEVRVSNISYWNYLGQPKLKCSISNCEFVIMNPLIFLEHLKNAHPNEKWNGVCQNCDKQILNGMYPLSKEYKHLEDAHLTTSKPHANSEREPTYEEVNTSDCNQRPVLKFRRLSGDILSGNEIKNNVSSTELIISSVKSISDGTDNTTPIATNSLKPWTKCENTKSIETKKLLLQHTSLVALYKCMATDCIFTTNDRNIMEKHLSSHEDFLTKPATSSCIDVNNDQYSWLECCYCDETLGSCELLISHIEKEHGTSIFQCAYCFYRSANIEFMTIHANKYHSIERTKHLCGVYACGLRMERLSEIADIAKALKTVARIMCEIEDCDQSFYNFVTLKRHLNDTHPGNVIRRCALCKQSFPNLDADEIDLTHYYDHNLSMFHCVFCSKYEWNIEQMQQHLSDFHSNKLPYLMQRILNGVDVDDEPKIHRLQLNCDKDMFTCSPLPEIQINEKNSLPGVHLSNISTVPNDIESPILKYADFISAYKDSMRNIGNAEKLYQFESLPLFQPANLEDFIESP